MNNIAERKKSKNLEIRLLVDKANNICSDFFKENYRYTNEEAIDELGLDDDLINQLVEDYVVQIITSISQFKEIINALQVQASNDEKLNFVPLHELAHKNLGVARNLRIKDAEKLLFDLMKKEDLDYLTSCLKVLESCTIKLKPTCAYNTLKLIKVKSSL